MSPIEKPTGYLSASGMPTSYVASAKGKVWSSRQLSRLNTSRQFSNRKIQSAHPEPICLSGWPIGLLASNVSKWTIYFQFYFFVISNKIPKHLKKYCNFLCRCQESNTTNFAWIQHNCFYSFQIKIIFLMLYLSFRISCLALKWSPQIQKNPLNSWFRKQYFVIFYIYAQIKSKVS